MPPAGQDRARACHSGSRSSQTRVREWAGLTGSDVRFFPPDRSGIPSSKFPVSTVWLFSGLSPSMEQDIISKGSLRVRVGHNQVREGDLQNIPAITPQSRKGHSMQDNRRQSLRVPLPVPLIVSDPKPHGFSEYCEIVMANGHGCQLRSPCPLEPGMQVRLDTVYVKNRAASATVIHSEPIGLQETRVWNCGLALDTPGNFWGIPSPPQDWPAADYSGANGIASFPPSPSERHPALCTRGRPAVSIGLRKTGSRC